MITIELKDKEFEEDLVDAIQTLIKKEYPSQSYTRLIGIEWTKMDITILFGTDKDTKGIRCSLTPTQSKHVNQYLDDGLKAENIIIRGP